MESLEKLAERELNTREKAFNSGNLGALKDAVALCHEYKIPLPNWVAVGLHDALNVLITDDKDEFKRWAKWRREYRQDMLDYAVYEDVKDAREHGASWQDGEIYAIAAAINSKVLEEDGGAKANTIEKTYKKVNARMSENPFRYFQLKTVKLRNDCGQYSNKLWNYVHTVIKAGKTKGLQNKDL